MCSRQLTLVDDLPVIRQNIQKGFQDTQAKLGRWISDFRKKLDGDEDEEEEETPPPQPPRRQNFGPSQGEQMYGIRRSAEAGRRSGDRDRYDADPRVLGDDFTQLELHDNDSEHLPSFPRDVP
jgi:Sec-independent protein translocase protein TatA